MAAEAGSAGAAPVKFLPQGSCPNFRFRSISQASDGASDSDSMTHAATGIRDLNKGKANRNRDFTVVDWFKDHIELVGSPRPELPQRQDQAETERSRQEAMRQVSFMSERYRAQLDQQRRDAMATRKVRSSPDLSAFEEKVRTIPAKPSRCPRCTSWCTSARLLEDAVREFRLRSAARKAGAHQSELAGSAVIIFDWDDTLLPTTYILQVVLPSLPEREREWPLPPTSPFYEEMASQAHLVAFILRTARRWARVAIVTNSMSPWVVASAARYLPGVNMEALLEELGIPVYYARRHVPELTKSTTYTEVRWSIEIDHSRNDRIGLDIIPSEGTTAIRIARVDATGLIAKWNLAHPGQQVAAGDWIVEVNGKAEGLPEECRRQQPLRIGMMREVPDRDPYMEAKRVDMKACLELFYSGRPDLRRNVLSIGDSAAEQTAVKEVLPRTGRPSTDPLCKTVNLLLRPTVQQLSNELRVLLVWLPYMVKYDKDFDLAMNHLDALEKKLFHPAQDQ